MVFPSNALDAAGLLRTAIRCDDPVLFLEHKRLYREIVRTSPVSRAGVHDSLRQSQNRASRDRSDGDHLRRCRATCLAGRTKAGTRAGRKVELIDLRSLNPFDWETIAASVAKTNRALVAYEDTLSWGYGAEIAARIADQLFDQLDAPVRRVAAKDTFVAYQPILEDAILPQPNDLYLAMKELAQY